MTTQLRRRIVFGLVMGTLMSAVMSFALTAFSIGFPADFVDIWLLQFFRAWVIAVPFVILIAPFTKRVVELLVPERPNADRRLYD